MLGRAHLESDGNRTRWNAVDQVPLFPGSELFGAVVTLVAARVFKSRS